MSSPRPRSSAERVDLYEGDPAIEVFETVREGLNQLRSEIQEGSESKDILKFEEEGNTPENCEKVMDTLDELFKEIEKEFTLDADEKEVIRKHAMSGVMHGFIEKAGIIPVVKSGKPELIFPDTYPSDIDASEQASWNALKGDPAKQAKFFRETGIRPQDILSDSAADATGDETGDKKVVDGYAQKRIDALHTKYSIDASTPEADILSNAAIPYAEKKFLLNFRENSAAFDKKMFEQMNLDYAVVYNIIQAFNTPEGSGFGGIDLGTGWKHVERGVGGALDWSAEATKYTGKKLWDNGGKILLTVGGLIGGLVILRSIWPASKGVWKGAGEAGEKVGEAAGKVPGRLAEAGAQTGKNVLNAILPGSGDGKLGKVLKTGLMLGVGAFLWHLWGPKGAKEKFDPYAWVKKQAEKAGTALETLGMAKDLQKKFEELKKVAGHKTVGEVFKDLKDGTNYYNLTEEEAKMAVEQLGPFALAPGMRDKKLSEIDLKIGIDGVSIEIGGGGSGGPGGRTPGGGTPGAPSSTPSGGPTLSADIETKRNGLVSTLNTFFDAATYNDPSAKLGLTKCKTDINTAGKSNIGEMGLRSLIVSRHMIDSVKNPLASYLSGLKGDEKLLDVENELTKVFEGKMKTFSFNGDSVEYGIFLTAAIMGELLNIETNVIKDAGRGEHVIEGLKDHSSKKLNDMYGTKFK